MDTLSVEQIRELYNEKVDLTAFGGKSTNIPRWGKFDRVLVGILLTEIDQLRSHVGPVKTEATEKSD